ncbi:MBL fold metallo-hydrolase [Sphingomonas sp. CGMCC 1.13654]|uniref:MBL fold metallo-hydrolase n=1 Tax=Sphingomonas chungangi TaxID=2683589 RepID=A0A838LE23_9SPHN|nr:MBL fold metallo-hydrolase [Sphingomonas chungangi]MBA2935728.1 MBL fold metallo-hydrolase [Sphingomonas chungangi]MVW54418.1 MBL fold metallo-hydrolase [Sphingomonas chungangi]
MRKRTGIGIVLATALLAALGYAVGRLGHPLALPASERLPSASLTHGTLDAQFFGTTTSLFRDGDHAVMVDSLLTRPGLGKVLFGTVAPDPALVRRILAQAQVERVDLLLVSHSHYDHVLDAPAVARATGTTTVGSPSTREVALGGGIPDAHIRVASGGEQLDTGAFHVTVFRSLHSPGDRVPGTITWPLSFPAKVKDYKEGGTFAFLIAHRGLSILVHPSANFVPGMYRGVHADAVFLATGGLGAQPDDFARAYWHEVVEATGAKLVVPIHWDDLLRPLDQPLLPLRRFMDDIPKGMAKIEPLAKQDGVAIRTMPVIVPVDIATAVRNLQEQ